MLQAAGGRVQSRPDPPFQFLLGCYALILLADGCGGAAAFNSFWDATGSVGVRVPGGGYDFQFLLGCYRFHS